MHQELFLLKFRLYIVEMVDRLIIELDLSIIVGTLPLDSLYVKPSEVNFLSAS